MACPFFYPTEPIPTAGANRRLHMPLGDLYSGECRAPASPERSASGCCRPSSDDLRNLCNLGYARGRCPRFDGAHPADALRFAVIRDRDGILGVSFVEERDHRPWRHGVLEYQAAAGIFVEAEGGASDLSPLVRQQAGAYLRAYLRRKAKPIPETRPGAERSGLAGSGPERNAPVWPAPGAGSGRQS